MGAGVPDVADDELGSVEPVESAEHFGKHRQTKAWILRRRQRAEMRKTEPRLQRRQVNEVPSFGASEDRKDLVDRELLGR